MSDTQEPALPESVSVAIKDAIQRLTTATPSEVPDVLFDLREAWIEAVEMGERIDTFAVFDAFPLLPPAIAEAAEKVLGEAEDDAIRRMPILLTYIDAAPVKALSGLRVISFEMGKAGDCRDRWENDVAMALAAIFKISSGTPPPRFQRILSALETAFDDGRAAGGFEDDPAAPPHPAYAARLRRAREAVAERLADADDLDDLADAIAADFGIQPGAAWLAVEESSRAAAVGGDAHAAALRLAQIVGAHSWFITHADKLRERHRMPVGVMIAADASRQFLAEVTA